MNAYLSRTNHPKGARSANTGFTFVDLLAVLAVVVLLSALAGPVLANPRLRSDRVVCANNLRQIGMAMQLWANDHGDAIPPEVSLTDGGTFGHPLAANVWLHFSWLSNELRSAQTVFMCIRISPTGPRVISFCIPIRARHAICSQHRSLCSWPIGTWGRTV